MLWTRLLKSQNITVQTVNDTVVTELYQNLLFLETGWPRLDLHLPNLYGLNAVTISLSSHQSSKLKNPDLAWSGFFFSPVTTQYLFTPISNCIDMRLTFGIFPATPYFLVSGSISQTIKSIRLPT